MYLNGKNVELINSNQGKLNVKSLKILKLSEKSQVNLFNLLNSFMVFSFSMIKNLESNYSGAIFNLYDSSIDIFNCIFKNIKTKQNGSIIYSNFKSNYYQNIIIKKSFFY